MLSCRGERLSKQLVVASLRMRQVQSSGTLNTSSAKGRYFHLCKCGKFSYQLNLIAKAVAKTTDEQFPPLLLARRFKALRRALCLRGTTPAFQLMCLSIMPRPMTNPHKDLAAVISRY